MARAARPLAVLVALALITVACGGKQPPIAHATDAAPAHGHVVGARFGDDRAAPGPAAARPRHAPPGRDGDA